MPTIVLEALTKIYPGGRGIHALDLAVERGEVFGFIGPNGAGKSTAIRTMLGLLTPTSGRVRVLGRDTHTDGPAVRSRVGYLPSEPRLYDGMSVGETLEYLGGFHAGDTRRRRRALADAVELDLSRRAEDLSIGNKKKVALVAALQHSPEVLILDEPTSGLDPLIQARFFEVLQSERERGSTVFFSSHVLSEVERMCDRVAILRDGRLAEVARTADLRGRQVKKVRVRLAASAAAAPMPPLPGAQNLVHSGDRLAFDYQGDMHALLAALGAMTILDVSIEDLSLEEVVLAHYGEAGHDG